MCLYWLLSLRLWGSLSSCGSLSPCGSLGLGGGLGLSSGLGLSNGSSLCGGFWFSGSSCLSCSACLSSSLGFVALELPNSRLLNYPDRYLLCFAQGTKTVPSSSGSLYRGVIKAFRNGYYRDYFSIILTLMACACLSFTAVSRLWI